MLLGLSRAGGLHGCQIAREKLVHLGTSIGKLTHTGKFRLTVGCLDLLAQHAKYKVRDFCVNGVLASVFRHACIQRAL